MSKENTVYITYGTSRDGPYKIEMQIELDFPLDPNYNQDMGLNLKEMEWTMQNKLQDVYNILELKERPIEAHRFINKSVDLQDTIPSWADCVMEMIDRSTYSTLGRLKPFLYRLEEKVRCEKKKIELPSITNRSEFYYELEWKNIHAGLTIRISDYAKTSIEINGSSRKTRCYWHGEIEDCYIILSEMLQQYGFVTTGWEHAFRILL